MKKTIALCILTALLFTGCAQTPVQPASDAPEVVEPAAPATETQLTTETTPATEEAPVLDFSGELTEEDAKNMALAFASLTADEVVFVKSGLETEDGIKVYDVEFYTEDFKEYDYEIDAATGEVLSYDTDAEAYDAPVADPTITEEDAKSLAIAKVPGAALTDIREFKADRDDGSTEYEGTIVYDNTEYDFEIDAVTGEFLSWEAESVSD